MRACAVKMHMDISQEANADPGASVLCALARSKCTWTYHKRHFVRKFTKKMPNANPGAAFWASLRGQSANRHVTRGILWTRKMPNTYPGASILCEPAQSKCTWTCHKGHFARKFIGKMPVASGTTSIEHRTFTVTVRTPQCGHCLGNKTL